MRINEKWLDRIAECFRIGGIMLVTTWVVLFAMEVIAPAQDPSPDPATLKQQLDEATARLQIVSDALVSIAVEVGQIQDVVADVASKITNVPPPGPIPVQQVVIDDGDPGFSTTGPWTHANSSFYGRYGDLTYIAANANGEASWSFTIPAGAPYTVWMSWVEHANRGTNVMVLVDGEVTPPLNQQHAPSQRTYDNIPWDKIGSSYVSDGTVVIKVVAPANGYSIADAVMIEYGDIQPTGMIIDDPDAEFVGSWMEMMPGYGGSAHYHERGSGTDKATWTFDNLTPGQFTVYATWPVGPLHATNAPFYATTSEGINFAGTFNQQEHPTTVIDGVEWEEIGVLSTRGTFMDIWTNDFADGNVIADAIMVLPSNQPPPADGTEELLVMINALRADLGAPLLTRTACLDDVAYERTLDLSLRPPADPHAGADAAIRSCAFYVYVGENAGFNHPTAEAIYLGWLNSMTHYLAMISPYFTLCGIGFDGSYVWYLELAG